MVMKKNVYLLGMCVVLALAIFGCGKKKELEAEVKTEKKEIVVENVEFEWEYKEVPEKGYMVEYATIRGCDKIGKVAWEIKTPEYPFAEVATVEKIGMCDDKFYYTENGKILALNMKDGKVAWENVDYKSCGIQFVFDENGILYCSGRTGMDLLVVDKEGNTQKSIPMLNEQYSEPMGIAIQDNQLIITFLNGPYEDEQYKKCIVELADFSYTFPQPPQPEPQPEPQPQPTQPSTTQKTQMSTNEMCDAIAAHYNALNGTTEYVCFDVDTYDNGAEYIFVLRTTAGSQANELVMSVYVNKSTGVATDELGHSWQLF